MPVQEALAPRSGLVIVDTKEVSLHSVLSGVRSFMVYAIYRLGYLADAGLPSRADAHILQWLKPFSQSCHWHKLPDLLVWWCQQYNLHTSWHSERVKLWIRGARKGNMTRVSRRASTPKPCRHPRGWPVLWQPLMRWAVRIGSFDPCLMVVASARAIHGTQRCRLATLSR